MNCEQLSTKILPYDIEKINKINYLPLRSKIIELIDNVKMVNPTFTLSIEQRDISCRSNVVDVPLEFYNSYEEMINDNTLYWVYAHSLRYAISNSKEYQFENNCCLSFNVVYANRHIIDKLLLHIRENFFKNINPKRSSKYKKIYSFLLNEKNVNFTERMFFTLIDNSSGNALTIKFDFFYNLINKIIEVQK